MFPAGQQEAGCGGPADAAAGGAGTAEWPAPGKDLWPPGRAQREPGLPDPTTRRNLAKPGR